MGLVQRKIEAAGFSTVSISNIPALTAAVSAPRVVGVEHPMGRTLGNPGDTRRHTAVLRASLAAIYEMRTPGGVRHLTFEWQEMPGPRRRPRRGPPPITRLLRKRPWLFPRLLARNVPADGRKP